VAEAVAGPPGAEATTVSAAAGSFGAEVVVDSGSSG